MTDSVFNNRCLPEAERSITGPFSGSATAIGTALEHKPVIIIFDNQSDVSVAISYNGVTWKTFVAGETFVQDMRANNGKAEDFTYDIGTQFYGTGTAGTGSFRISTQYAG